MCPTFFRRLFALAAALLATGAAAAPMLLVPERVWPGAGRAQAGWTVLVDGGRIVAAGPAARVAVPPDAACIELPGRTLIPGLIDMHSHVLLHPYNEKGDCAAGAGADASGRTRLFP